MAKIEYISKKFRGETLQIIEAANEIIYAYTAQDLDLTLRQLYYQFIARDLFPESWIDPETGSKNNERSYKRLGTMINNGRLAGYIDWDAITDRTRNIRQASTWSSPTQILRAVARQYRLDKWSSQDVHMEVWIEKDALIGTIERVCTQFELPYFSCRGYVSQSEMHSAAMRLKRIGKRSVILHLGDHDPSGIDMSRDINDRLYMFLEYEDVDFEIRRIALNRDQILSYNPPPNPAKETDARWRQYFEETGFNESWELDALDPTILSTLIENEIVGEIDYDLWLDMLDTEKEHIEKIKAIQIN